MKLVKTAFINSGFKKGGKISIHNTLTWLNHALNMILPNKYFAIKFYYASENALTLCNSIGNNNEPILCPIFLA